MSRPQLLVSALCATLIAIVHAVKVIPKPRTEAEMTECRRMWLFHLREKCMYPGQGRPCLALSSVQVKDEEGDSISPMFNPKLFEIAHECCSDMCILRSMEHLCCRTPQCLTRCYRKFRGHLFRHLSRMAQLMARSYHTRQSVPLSALNQTLFV